MVSFVGINGAKTPITTGSAGTAQATLPNVCGMPDPAPQPNIGMSGLSPQGYALSVTIAGHPVAIQGASCGSTSVVSASCGSTSVVGASCGSTSAADPSCAPQTYHAGILSGVAHGRTHYVGLGALNVRIEGQGVYRLGDPALNNCTPDGAVPNAATLPGVLQTASVTQDPAAALTPSPADPNSSSESTQ